MTNKGGAPVGWTEEDWDASIPDVGIEEAEERMRLHRIAYAAAFCAGWYEADEFTTDGGA